MNKLLEELAEVRSEISGIAHAFTPNEKVEELADQLVKLCDIFVSVTAKVAAIEQRLDRREDHEAEQREYN